MKKYIIIFILLFCVNAFANEKAKRVDTTTTNFDTNLSASDTTVQAALETLDEVTAGHSNGANCSAGSYPLGVDGSGAVESCTDASTETDSIVATHTADDNAHHNPVTLSGTGTYLTLTTQDIQVDSITESDISDLSHTVEADTLQTVTDRGNTVTGVNIGIGTTDPQVILDVDGTVELDSLRSEGVTATGLNAVALGDFKAGSTIQANGKGSMIFGGGSQVGTIINDGDYSKAFVAITGAASSVSIASGTLGANVFGLVGTNAKIITRSSNVTMGSANDLSGSGTDTALLNEAFGSTIIGAAIATSNGNAKIHVGSGGTGSTCVGNAFGLFGQDALIQCTNLGSVAMGNSVAISAASNLISSAAGSIAMGYAASSTLSATNNGSIAMGFSNSNSLTSSGIGSIAMGIADSGGTLTSTGQGSVAFGESVNATAANAISLGRDFTNANDDSFAVGYDTVQLFVDGDNNAVGIGNTAPSFALDVTGTVNATAEVRAGGHISLPDGSKLNVEGTAGDTYFIREANTVRLYLDNTLVREWGALGDIELGDSTLRVMYPQTDLKIDLGQSANRFNDGWFGNDLIIGTAQLNSSKLTIDGDTDQVQATIQGHSTQTNDMFIVENSAGTDLLSVSSTAIFSGAATVDFNLTNEFQVDGALTDFGTGTYSVADGDNDVGIAGDLEVLGAFSGSRQSFVMCEQTATTAGSGVQTPEAPGRLTLSTGDGFPLARDGSIVSMAINTTIAGGTFPAHNGNIDMRVFLNDVNVYSVSNSITANGTYTGYGTQARGIDTFSAGDRLRMNLNYTTGTTWTSDDMCVSVEIVYDT